MAQNINDGLLFHLVPANEAAQEALSHVDNLQFVSLASTNQLGLEIGFHVPPFSRGHVITRLGRNADLILRQSYSAVHIAFELQPETRVILLSVRTKHTSSVIVSPVDTISPGDITENAATDISGDCVLVYGQRYLIHIASYSFGLVWRLVSSENETEALKRLTMQGYESAMEALKYVRSRDISIAPDTSTARSWYMTRLQSAKAPVVSEIKGSRVLIGEGGFGKVYKAMDKATGRLFAIKAVDLTFHNKTELARSALHKEIKIMEGILHHNIIECLGSRDFHTETPLIFMPLRDGNLASLARAATDPGALCEQVLPQMLRALDYLAFRNICHRDVKPQNILYEKRGGDEYHFQLADFGLANDFRVANTVCGTEMYLAPEICRREAQSPKIDIWSLFVTVVEIHPRFDFPPRNWAHAGDITPAVQRVAATTPKSQPMARIDPALRASAAQMLVAEFNGEGLTTPQNKVPPIPIDPAEQAPLTPAQFGVQTLHAAPPQASPQPPPLVIYERRRQPPLDQPRFPAVQRLGRSNNNLPPNRVQRDNPPANNFARLLREARQQRQRQQPQRALPSQRPSPPRRSPPAARETTNVFRQARITQARAAAVAAAATAATPQADNNNNNNQPQTRRRRMPGDRPAGQHSQATQPAETAVNVNNNNNNNNQPETRRRRIPGDRPVPVPVPVPVPLSPAQEPLAAQSPETSDAMSFKMVSVLGMPGEWLA